MRLKALVLAALLTLPAGLSHAQSTQLGLNAGFGMPTGDFGDVVNTGYYVGGSAAYLMNPQFGFGVDFAYHSWAGSDDANAAADFLLGTTGSETSASAIQATGFLLLALQTQGSIDPWFKAGAGLYNLGAKIESPVLDDDTSESKFGFNLGAGFDYRNSPAFGIGVDATYHMIPAEDDFGVDVSMFTAGVHWTWSSAK